MGEPLYVPVKAVIRAWPPENAVVVSSPLAESPVALYDHVKRSARAVPVESRPNEPKNKGSNHLDFQLILICSFPLC